MGGQHPDKQLKQCAAGGKGIHQRTQHHAQQLPHPVDAGGHQHETEDQGNKQVEMQLKVAAQAGALQQAQRLNRHEALQQVGNQNRRDNRPGIAKQKVEAVAKVDCLAAMDMQGNLTADGERRHHHRRDMEILGKMK